VDLARRVILLEFNEIVPKLLDRFIAEGRLPNFERLRNRSKAMVTDAQEMQEHLEPWIQWITIHSGLSYREHGIFHLADGNKLKDKCLWDLVSDDGGRVWVCGSMNVRYDRPLNGMLLPDAWSTGAMPYPDDLLPFCRFLQTYVQEHTNDRVPLATSDYVAFAKYILSHGLSAHTIVSIAKQLVGERFGSRRGWRRAVLLDKLLWDVFSYHYRRVKPNFATFFSNSTAHYQHKFWRNMEPEHFALKPSALDQAEYRDAILFGYEQMDHLVGRCLEMADDKTCILLLSSLSQQPYLKLEQEGGKRFYRPRTFDKFRDAFRLKGVINFRPVMSEQFHIEFESREAALVAKATLSAVTLGQSSALAVEDDGASLFCGCRVFRQIESDELLALPGREPFKFYELFYQADSLKSGMHHPDGVFWMTTNPSNRGVVEGKVPLKDVAPTVLDILGVARPPYMTGQSKAT
jgi:hypothetical protein